MSPKEAAEWMLDLFKAHGFLYQQEVASHLITLHDEDLVYFDSSGNIRIGKQVLAEFNRLTPDAVYERTDKFWRNRLSTDQPSRQQ